MSFSLTITCPSDSRSIVWGFYCINGDHDGFADHRAKNLGGHELHSILKDLESKSAEQAQKFFSQETKSGDEIRDE
jgi:hypothetical protein